MVSERLEVRLDTEHRRKLAEVAAFRSLSVSEAVRQMIDRAYEEVDREERLRAVREMGEMKIPVPDPETLKRLLAEAHDPRVD